MQRRREGDCARITGSRMMRAIWRFHGKSPAHHASQSHGHEALRRPDTSGQFKDIQTYERAHRADLAKTSKAEKTSRKTAGRRKAAKKR
jgi:hypothetical protein